MQKVQVAALAAKGQYSCTQSRWQSNGGGGEWSFDSVPNSNNQSHFQALFKGTVMQSVTCRRCLKVCNLTKPVLRAKLRKWLKDQLTNQDLKDSEVQQQYVANKFAVCLTSGSLMFLVLKNSNSYYYSSKKQKKTKKGNSTNWKNVHVQLWS